MVTCIPNFQLFRNRFSVICRGQDCAKSLNPDVWISKGSTNQLSNSSKNTSYSHEKWKGSKYGVSNRWPLLYRVFNFFEICFQISVANHIWQKIVIPFFEIRILKQSTNQLKKSLLKIGHFWPKKEAQYLGNFSQRTPYFDDGFVHL